LNNPLVNNIGVRVRFSADSGSGRVPTDIDFVQVETCY